MQRVVDHIFGVGGAGIPINLDRAISDGPAKAGDVVLMAAARWGGRG